MDSAWHKQHPLYYNIFYHKIIRVQFCDITLSHSSAASDVLGEMFTLKLYVVTPVLLPCPPHSRRWSFCQSLEMILKSQFIASVEKLVTGRALAGQLVD